MVRSCKIYHFVPNKTDHAAQVGAWGWGSCPSIPLRPRGPSLMVYLSPTDSDSQGRTPAFNFTLLLTAVFGILSAFAPTFPWLCLALFGLGTGVGGSMPTDGTLCVDNSPIQYCKRVSRPFLLDSWRTSLRPSTISSPPSRPCSSLFPFHPEPHTP